MKSALANHASADVEIGDTHLTAIKVDTLG